MILDLHRQGAGISAIARRTGLDRKTVRKVIATGLEPPAYGPRQPKITQLQPFERYLRERLDAVPELTGRRLHRELVAMGYHGGYTAVTDLLRRDPADHASLVRGAVRDAAGPSGPGRLRPFPHRVH